MWGRRISQVGDGSRVCQAYKRQGDVRAVSAVGTGTLGETWDDLVPLGRRTNGYQCPTACPSMFRPGVLMCTGLWIYGPTTPSCLSPSSTCTYNCSLSNPQLTPGDLGCPVRLSRAEICRGSGSQLGLRSPHLWRGGGWQCPVQGLKCALLGIKQEGWLGRKKGTE